MKPNNLLSFLTGALVGAGITWLFSSKEGKQLMEKIKSNANTFINDFENEWDKTAEDVNSLKDNSKI